MTWHKRTVAACGIALLASVGACDKGLTDVNKNPNAPDDANASLLFPTAAVSSLRMVRATMEITPSAFAHWPQYLGEYQYPEISYYQFRTTTADGWWNTWYSAGPIADLEVALRKTKAANRPDQIAPILVLRAFDFSTMTGLWGDIPFSEAAKGDQGLFLPTYDAQSVIYDSLFTNLTDANTMLAAAGTGFGSADPVYGGDVAQWKKFANSLRARLGLNLSNRNAVRAQAEVAAAIAAGGFASNADNAKIVWPGDGVNNNPWCDTQKEGTCGGTRDDARASLTFIDTLKSYSDPRLSVWFRPVQDPTCGTTPSCTPVAAGEYRGMPNGIAAGPAGAWGTKASRIGFQVFDAKQPSFYMTYAEFSFIKAEAAKRGWCTTGCTNGDVSAAQYYSDGITASMQQWSVPAASITTYLANANVVYNPATALRQIAVQKWIAFFTQGYESWSEWRRTGFPNLTPSTNAVTSDGLLPRRVIYPQTEQSFNNTNLQAAITAQGGAELHNKIWIDP